MPEANGYYRQCIHLTTRAKHMPPGQEGDLPEGCTTQYMPPRCLLTYAPGHRQPKQLSSSQQGKVSPSTPHDSRIVLASTWVSVWECYSSAVCSGFTTIRQIPGLARLEAKLQRPGSCTDLIGSRIEAKTPETSRDRGD